MRSGYAPEAVLAHHDAVDHDLDVVAVLLLQADLLVAELADLAVDAHAREALAAQVLKELGVLSLAVKDHGGEHEGAAPLGALEDLVGNLVGGLARDGSPALGAVRSADAGKEQTQVVVDLRHGAHRRAGVSRRGLLVNGDRGGKAVDAVQIRLVHLPQELSCVAGEGLHVTTLTLGIDGVKGEARLARAGEAGDDDEPVARDVDVDVSEVVLAGAADDDGVLGHGSSLGCATWANRTIVPVWAGGVLPRSTLRGTSLQNTAGPSQSKLSVNRARRGGAPGAASRASSVVAAHCGGGVAEGTPVFRREVPRSALLG